VTNIRRHVLAELDDQQRELLLQRAQQAPAPEVVETVERTVADVRQRGDDAVVEHTERFDGVRLEPARFMVSDAEFEQAEKSLEPVLRAAIDLAIENIRAHHLAQKPAADWIIETHAGALTGERTGPIASAGLYVPRGKGSFPSVMAMLGVPATLAQVPSLAVCTPPGPAGEVDAASLYAARKSGIRTVFRVGGAQAIAALAYGTETITRVEKIVGPGNQYVTYAKRLVYGAVDPGPPAGPSESIILADAHADAQTVAEELLVEAEHGSDSAALLVTDSDRLADAVTALLPDLLALLPEQRREFCESVLNGFGGIVIARDLDDAVAFTNEWAPEHLHVLVREPLSLLYQITNAGEILLGDLSSIAFGNYVIGPNAILPTGGFARAYSCVGVNDFLKRSSFAYVTAACAKQIGPAAIALAEYEGFPSHASAARGALKRATSRQP
jgi:histidinol dehydrogenase